MRGERHAAVWYRGVRLRKQVSENTIGLVLFELIEKAGVVRTMQVVYERLNGGNPIHTYKKNIGTWILSVSLYCCKIQETSCKGERLDLLNDHKYLVGL